MPTPSSSSSIESVVPVIGVPPKSMSLTPESRNAETTHEAMVEGMINGMLTFLPTVGALAIALKASPTFAARTNWQSRTALAIMPALFVATLTSEQKLIHKMKEVAAETEHSIKTVHWAEEQMKERQQKAQQQLLLKQESVLPGNEYQLRELYRQSLLNRDDNVCVVPGDTLSWYHRTANFVAANPIKVLASLAIPSVAWIYYGNSTKGHLEFSHKILHTRVFGQFATISCLLGVMTFKDFMDKNGRFISEAEANDRVAEMQQVRIQLIQRLQAEHEHEEQLKREIQEAHEADLREQHSGSTKHKKHGHHKKNDGTNTKEKNDTTSPSLLNASALVEDAA